ncbi:MAG: hypothetical protein ACOCPP_04510, partial [Desulfovermiculus sp.]
TVKTFTRTDWPFWFSFASGKSEIFFAQNKERSPAQSHMRRFIFAGSGAILDTVGIIIGML